MAGRRTLEAFLPDEGFREEEEAELHRRRREALLGPPDLGGKEEQSSGARPAEVAPGSAANAAASAAGNSAPPVMSLGLFDPMSSDEEAIPSAKRSVAQAGSQSSTAQVAPAPGDGLKANPPSVASAPSIAGSAPQATSRFGDVIGVHRDIFDSD
mmetsp:Transcript_17361/g.30876  ORF Transcript_17361/g.30876 Transcript_17361/m.30876 type:complete len:155 (-) Transcript_17361:86-550(-)